MTAITAFRLTISGNFALHSAQCRKLSYLCTPGGRSVRHRLRQWMPAQALSLAIQMAEASLPAQTASPFLASGRGPFGDRG